MTRIASLLVCLVVAAGCGGKQRMASAPMAAMAGAPPAAAPPPLDRSVFARDPNGQLSEDALQKILAILNEHAPKYYDTAANA